MVNKSCSNCKKLFVDGVCKIKPRLKLYKYYSMLLCDDCLAAANAKIPYKKGRRLLA
jgi:hypothetical protein